MRERRDLGQFCLQSSADLRLSFSVNTGDACLSACDRHRLSCSANLDGTRIELEALLQSQDLPGDLCPDSCESAAGTCTLDVPAPGTYQFAFASGFDSATLPSAGSIPLFDDRACTNPFE